MIGYQDYESKSIIHGYLRVRHAGYQHDSSWVLLADGRPTTYCNVYGRLYHMDHWHFDLDP